MAISSLENLYPPIMQTYMPAFVKTESCRIYFQLATVNSIDEIFNLQVSITSQSSNQTALNLSRYPSEIMIVEKTRIKEAGSGYPNNTYYFELNPTEEGEHLFYDVNSFAINEFYKVQIRLTKDLDSVEIDYPVEEGASIYSISNWLALHINDFSEWSTVCLIKAIEKPILDLVEFKASPEVVTLESQDLNVVGKMTFEENADIEKEILHSYQVSLFKIENELEKKIYTSDVLYTNRYNSPNEINYTIPVLLTDFDKTYFFKISYRTVNGYESEEAFYFNLDISEPTLTIDSVQSAIGMNEDGVIKIHVKGLKTGGVITNPVDEDTELIIRRSKIGRENISIWETVYDAIPEYADEEEGVSRTYQDSIGKSSTAGEQIWNFTWVDKTAESGVFYNYSIQFRKEIQEGESTITKISEAKIIPPSTTPPILDLRDVFVGGEGKLLKIKYNPNISSTKINVGETKTETIGSKYPYVRRNGNMYYRSFSIGGLIYSFDNGSDLFISEEDVYDMGGTNWYTSYNRINRINPDRNYIYERKYREEVLKFLYNGKVKLYRSAQEGNILIRLTDISLTPDNTSGRLIYSFSATATEIAECSVENYLKYNIIDLES